MSESIIITSTLVLSLLHGLIPSHWLPIVAIGRKENWSIQQITKVALWSAVAHALSTVLIGVLLAIIGKQAHNEWEEFFHIVAPTLMISLGLAFIYKHYTHHHFHLHKKVDTNQSQRKVIAALVGIMFLSPCFEVEVYFLTAGGYGWGLPLLLAAIYTFSTVIGIVLWVRLAHAGLKKMNWHAIEHNSGIITGSILVITGIISLFYY